MPSNWFAMDDNFPTFTGEESPSQQISALHNYLYQMREGLQYSMRNLTADNFNEAALQQLTDEQKNAVAEELQKLRSTITSFANEISSLSARVSSLENLGGRMNQAEDAITRLEEDSDRKTATLHDHEQSISYLEKSVGELPDGEADLVTQLHDAQKEVGNLQADMDALEQEAFGEGGLKERTAKLEETVRGEGGLSEKIEAIDLTLSGEGGLEQRTEALETEVLAEGGLKDRTAKLEESIEGEGGVAERIGAIELAINGEGGLTELMQTVQTEQEKVAGAMKVDDNGDATLGGEGKKVYLVGEIYINGTLFQNGGEAT